MIVGTGLSQFLAKFNEIKDQLLFPNLYYTLKIWHNAEYLA